MPNSVAEAYLLILRPSMIPVVGEAVPIPFNEQIEIDEWSWTLENDDFVKRQGVLEKAKAALEAENDSGKNSKDSAEKIKKSQDLKSITHQISVVYGQTGKSQAQRDKEIKALMARMKKLTGEAVDDAEEEAEQTGGTKKTEARDEEGKLQFTFKKNVDAATTQLLNSMKNGDTMPRAILTLFHRSSNAPVTLAIKFEKVRLKKYELSVDPTETMSDMKEEWTANYESVEWSYQNRPPASGPNGVTQGTVRVFKKKSGSLI